jgi:ribokinase
MGARVAVVGSINMDLVVGTETLPKPGETVLASNLRRFGGGKGANQALAAARMGAEVSLVGRVGDDEFGSVLLDDLQREGVDVSAVGRVEESTGVALITVDAAGGNTIVVALGANARLRAEDVEAARATIEGSRALLLQLEVPLEANVRAAQIARGACVPVFLNPSPAIPLPEDLLDRLSYLVLNEGELEVLAGEAGIADGLLGRGVEALVLTLGERGARLITPEGTRDVAAYPVRSVDSTAAGDAFLGALAATLPERGIDAALEAAAAAGALATTRWGAQAALPTRDEVEPLVVAGRSAGGPRRSAGAEG